MARVLGVNIPDNKRSEIALTYIFGVGRSQAVRILAQAGVDKNKHVAAWSDAEAKKIREAINETCTIEGELRSRIRLDIKRLMEIACYRGKRHSVGLPVSGQKTKNNARTRKGKRKTMANKKKATK